MEKILHLVSWYPLFGIPAGVGWLAIWVSAGHKRIDLQRGDKALLILPWIVLYGLSLALPNGKSLANFAEILLLALCVPAAMLLRTILGRVPDQARLADRLALGVSAAAAVIWWLVPPLDGA